MKHWYSTKEALQYCKERDRHLTNVGLKYLGILHRFVRKKEDGHHLEYNIKGLDRITTETYPYEGYVNVKQIAEKLNIALYKVYYILYKYDIELYKYGHNRIYHFSEKEFMNAYEKNNK